MSSMRRRAMAATLVGLFGLIASGRRTAAQLIPGIPSQLPSSAWGIPVPPLPTAAKPNAPPPSDDAAPLYATGLNYMDPASYLKLAVAFAPSMMSSVPSAVDLSADFPPVGSQGMQGSCVAWAVGYGLKSFQEHEQYKWAYTNDHLFSPAFIYNQMKKGACFPDGLNVGQALDFVAENGVAPLSAMPYDASTCLTQPSTNAVTAAKAFRLHSVRRVEKDIVEIKGLLAARTPVVIAMDLDKSFHQLKGTQIYQGATGPTPSGHAMVIAGYDDAKQAVKLLNSWGTKWGDNGYGWVSYAALLKQSREFYVTKDYKEDPTPNKPGPTPPPPVSVGSPVAVLTAPSTMKNILVGSTYYFGLAVAGSIDNAQSRKYQLVVRFRRNGQPIVSKDSRYADGHGFLAADTPTALIPSKSYNLSGAPSIAIPQLTLRQSLGAVSGQNVEIETFYDAYVDGFHVGRSPSAKVSLTWN